MNREELTKKYKEKDLLPLKAKEVMTINYRPHPFMIGPKHITFANDKYYGTLGDGAINDPDFPLCSDKGCNLSHSEHKYDTILAFELTKDVPQDEASAVLKSINDEVEADGIDGYIFIENKFEFTK